MKKFFKIYLSVYSFVIMVTSLIAITNFFNNLDLPNGLSTLYMFVHIGSFALMIAYADKL